MRALVIEDDDDKLQDILQFLSDNYEWEDVAVAKSLQSGLRLALTQSYAVVLLDMTMRNFDRTMLDDGGRPHAFAGREILRQMRRDGVDTPVIVVTHFDRFGEEADSRTLEELKAELQSRFPNYLATVQYRGNIDEWKLALKGLIDQAVSLGNH